MASPSQILALLLFSTFLFSSLSSATYPPRRPFKKIYAFGDSYTDTGNTRTATGPIIFNYVSNPPYGVTYFHHSTNRYSDGRLVIDFVAEALSLPFLPPYVNHTADTSHGVNFAVAGATAIKHSFFVKNNLTLNLVPQTLQTQLSWFNKLLESKESKEDLDESLIWVGEIGANDYSCSIGSHFPRKTIQALGINSLTRFLRALLNKGAKYIVVQGLPPMGCLTYSFMLSSPDDRDELGCVASMNKQVSTHNAALQAKLNILREEFPKSVIVYADFYNAHLTVLKNAKKYGLKELYKACCGYGGRMYNFDLFNCCGSPSSSSCDNPSQYINWDGAHLTEAVHKVMAASFLNGTDCHPPFNYLLNKKLQSG
ncbi:GDSL esterase/lipase [Abeliophyllum distichum]|uniref:GDSL esterase/lipase n=1 Tax=Abeliophyllum distichum TaxID=126358 RepID=A0ABD1RV38_9LAMI